MKFYMLDGNEKILCAVPSKDIISLYQNLNYHQADTIEGSLVLSEKYTSILNNVRYFAISDRESNHNFYLYRKTLIQVQSHEIAINGQGAFWDEMQGAYIKDRRPNKVTPADTIKLILSYSRWNVDFVDQMLEEEELERDMNFYYVSLLDALNTVYKTWQVDIVPYINIEGHQITRRYVKLHRQQGGNNGRRFVYGENALTVTQQANEGSIFTALVGRGAGIEETDANGNPTGGYSRKINFADVEWSKDNGDPCDKPKGQEYVEWKESTEIYGYSDGKPRIGIVNFENEKDPAQLLKDTWAQLQQVGVPLVQFQATVGDVGYLNLGETVTIVRYDLNIKYQTRVTGIKWNRCDEKKSKITIGVKAIQSTADKIAGLQQSVAQANVNADAAVSTANHAIIDGKGAVVNYGPNQPSNPKEGDIWYDVQPDGTVVLKQYKNGQWIILIDDTTGQQIKNKVDAQQKELSQAVQDANNASTKVDGLVAQVGDANTNAQKAMATAEQNQEELSLAKNQLSNVQTDLSSTKSTLSGAIADITQAKSDLTSTNQHLETVQSGLAGTQNQLVSDEKQMSNLTAQAQKQGQTITSLQNTQSGLSADVADVKGNVSSLQATASGLQATVKDNQGSISRLQETARGLESDVADNKNNISAIKQTATSMSSTISNITDGNRTNYLSHTSSKPVTQTSMDNGNLVISPDRYLGELGLKAGETVTFSVYIENAPDDANVQLQFYQSNSATWGWISNVNGNVILKGQSGYSSVTTTIPSNAGSLISLIYCKTAKSSITYSQAEIVIGNTRLPWTACLRDLATSQNISEINQTIDSIKSTVSNNGGDIAQIKQTAKSIEDNVSDNKNNISVLKQTATSLQSSISDNANSISSIKQTATGLESTVSNLTNKNWTNYLSHTSNKTSSLVLNNQGKCIISPDRYLGELGLKVGEQITFSAYIENASDDTNVELQFYESNSATWGWISNVEGNVISKGKSGYSSVTTTIPNNAGSLVPVIYGKTSGLTINYSQAEIVIGDTRLPWTACQRDLATSQDVSSINQTINSIKSNVSSNTGAVSQLEQTAQSLQSAVKDNQGNISKLQQTANGIESDVADNKNNISAMKQTATSMSSIISNITDGNRTNYLSHTSSKPVTQACMDNGNLVISPDRYLGELGLKAGEVVTFSVYIENAPDDTNVILQFYQSNSATWGWINGVNGNVISKGQSGYSSVTTTIPSNAGSLVPVIHCKTAKSQITYSQAEIVIGNTRLPWTACQRDLATSQDISLLKQTASTLESNISNNKNDISSLKQTAQSLQSNIQSKTDISQFTQLSNAFQTVVQNIGPFYPNGDFNDTDLSKYYDPWDTCKSLSDFSVNTQQSKNHMTIASGKGVVDKAIIKEYLPVNAKKPVVFKGKSLLYWNTSEKLKASFLAYFHFYDSDKNEISNQGIYYKYDTNSVWQDFSLSVTPPSNTAFIRIETVLDNSQSSNTVFGGLEELRIENGTATISSKISQIQDDINLRVQKGDLLSQINIEAGKTLIQSQNLFLDASTVTFSGNAFIPSAAITDLSADKITAGTLNAGNVNIINLDVDKLVGDTTEFVRSGWTDAYGSHVQIDGGGMSITYGDWYTKFDGSGMTFKDGDEALGGFTRAGMQGAPSWYNGLAFNAGGDAEFLAIGAQDYHNDDQDPVPAKLLWMRDGIDNYNYKPGWNFCDKVWADQVGMNSIQYGDQNIKFGLINGANGFKGITLTSGQGGGFFWGNDGGFGFVANNHLYNVVGSKIITNMDNNGAVHEWIDVQY